MQKQEALTMNQRTTAGNAVAGAVKRPTLPSPSSKVVIQVNRKSSDISNLLSSRPSKTLTRPLTSTVSATVSKSMAVVKQPKVHSSGSNPTTSRTVRTSVTTFTTKPRMKPEKSTAPLFNVTNFSATKGISASPSTKILACSVSPQSSRVQRLAPEVKSVRTQKGCVNIPSGRANKLSFTNACLGSTTLTSPQPKPQSVLKETPVSTLKKSSIRSVIHPKDRPIASECVRCDVCMRGFLPERISKHREACLKMESRPKKIFNATAMRTAGTEQESYIRKGAHKKEVPVRKSNWRAQHEEFLNNVREAKKVQDHLARGGKLSDLPPPRPSENPDYVPCPHCGRKFNESAAARHIPKCANIVSNKKTAPCKKK